MAIGLVCFALWRLLQAGLDADRLGTEWQALLRRAGFAISAAVNAALAISAVGTHGDSVFWAELIPWRGEDSRHASSGERSEGFLGR